MLSPTCINVELGVYVGINDIFHEPFPTPFKFTKLSVKL